jgi:DNA-binding NarL/FixJ family response regulator
LIKQHPEFRLAGTTQGWAQIEQRAENLQADVAVVDLDHAQPTLSSVTMPPVVALIDDPEAQWIAQALKSGVRGILARDAEKDALVPAIHAAHAGFLFFDGMIGDILSTHIRAAQPSDDALLEELTPREIEVLQMLTEGLGNREMATRLGISEHTVKFHISSILGKLGAGSRTEAVTQGIRQGLIIL